jgi:hypothetical protein
MGDSVPDVGGGTWNGRDGGEDAVNVEERILVAVWAYNAAMGITYVILLARLTPVQKSRIVAIVPALNAVQVMLATIIVLFYLSVGTWASWTIAALGGISCVGSIIGLSILNKHWNSTRGDS